MPVVKEREYRALATPLMAANTNKRIDTEYLSLIHIWDYESVG